MSQERLGIFGGTFDPVHNAHLRAALEAVEAVGLDRVIMVPCAQPPHGKMLGAQVDQRLEMMQLALGDDPIFEVSDIEARRGGPSYTSATLFQVSRLHENARIFFLIGADAFFWLHTWNDPVKLFKLADFVVLARPKSPKNELLHYMKNRLHPDFEQAEDGWVRLPSGHGARRVPTTLLSISSTDIRRRAAQGLSLRYLVPGPVEDYIKRMKLYQHPRS
jgi:nicotinate-nucleotide adenylyltransferase